MRSIVLTAVLVACVSAQLSRNYQFSYALDGASPSLLVFHYSIVGTTIEMGLEAGFVDGYAAVAFSNGPTMNGLPTAQMGQIASGAAPNMFSQAFVVSYSATAGDACHLGCILNQKMVSDQGSSAKPKTTAVVPVAAGTSFIKNSTFYVAEWNRPLTDNSNTTFQLAIGQTVYINGASLTTGQITGPLSNLVYNQHDNDYENVVLTNFGVVPTLSRTYQYSYALDGASPSLLVWHYSIIGNTMQMALEVGFVNGYGAVAFSNGPTMNGLPTTQMGQIASGAAPNMFSQAYVVSYSPTAGDLCYLGCVLNQKMVSDQNGIAAKPNTTNVVPLAAGSTFVKNSTFLVAEWDRTLTDNNPSTTFQLAMGQSVYVNGVTLTTGQITGKAAALNYLQHDNDYENVMIVIGAASTIATPTPTAATNLTYGTYTSTDGSFWATYQFVDAKTMQFNMSAYTTGWIAMGFGPAVQMQLIDCYVGWVSDTTGQVTLFDSWSPDTDQPPTDVAQGGTDDATNIAGSQYMASNGKTVTTISFTRLLNTGDKYDLPIVQGQNLYLQWAWANADGTVTGTGTTAVPTYETHESGNGEAQGGLVNFFAVGLANSSTSGTTGAGTVTSKLRVDYFLVIFVFSILGAYLLIRWVWKLIKWQSSTQIKHRFPKSSSQTDLLDTSSSNTNLHNNTNSSSTANLGPLPESSNPRNLAYFRGGEEVARPRAPPTNAARRSMVRSFVAPSAGFVPPPMEQRSSGSVPLPAPRVRKDSAPPPIAPKPGKPTQAPRNPMYADQTGTVSKSSSSSLNLLIIKENPATAIDVDAEMAATKTKSSGNRYTNFMQGVGRSRVPFTQIALEHVLIALVFIACNIVALVIGKKDDYGDGFGWLAAANSFFVLIPATRNSVLSFLLGIPFDRAIMFHRWLGYWIVLICTIHAILEWVNFESEGGAIQNTFYKTHNLYGFVAWLVAIAIFPFTANWWMRRFHFEWFYYTHFMFILFYTFASLHEKGFIPYMIAAVVFYALDRIIRFILGIWFYRTTLIRVKGNPVENRDSSIIQIKFPKNRLQKMMNTYKVGQYVFVNFPQISISEWHPFSVSSGPDEKDAEIHVRGLGDHTSQLLEHAQRITNTDTNASLLIRIDGPYGNLKLSYRRFPVIMLIAGGIGITPVIGILKDLFRVGEIDTATRPLELAHRNREVHVLWTVKSAAQYNWFREEFQQCLEKASQGLGVPGFAKVAPPALHLHIFVTGDAQNMFASEAFANKQASLVFTPSRPNLTQSFSDVVRVMGSDACLVFACGPAAMVNECWDCAATESRSGASFKFHCETFEF